MTLALPQGKCNAPDPRKSTGAGVVGLQLRCVGVFRHFARLEVVSDKMALSRPADQYPAESMRGITPAVGWLLDDNE